MLDDGFVWGYLLGRYEDGIAGFLSRCNRRTRGALAAFVFGFCLSIIPAYFLVGGLATLAIALIVGVAAVLLTWLWLTISAVRLMRGRTMRLHPRQHLR